MITIFSFIPDNYIKHDNNSDSKPTISLFSSIKTSILNQTYTKWELLLVTNHENVLLQQQDSAEAKDKRIKIVYTPDSYLNLNTLFQLNNNNNNNNNNNSVINPQCKYISFFDLEHDVWNVNKLQIQFNLMASSDYDVIGCECTPSTQSISAIVPRTVKKSESSLFMSCPFLFSTALIKRELFQHYDETVFQNEYEKMNDRNFALIHTENNTLIAQFHAFLLYMTLIERNIYCIQYSNGGSSSSSGSSSGLVRRQCMNWFEYLYVELKKYLLQKYIPGMSDSDANKSAMIFLDEIRQLRRESDEPVMSNAFKTNTLHQIDLMDAEIKNGLLGWFADRGIESMYKTNRPYENVANYVVLNEYDASDWNKIYPLLGKTDINSIDDHSVQQANLLKVLKKMEKMSSQCIIRKAW